MKHQYLILSFLMAFTAQVGSVSYYVSPSGSDSNSGLSPAEAFLTIQKACDLVTPGDSVLVSDGQYSGFDCRMSGSPGNPITFLGLGTQVIINQPGPIRNDGINIENADYIIIDGFQCLDMPGNGNGIRLVLSDHCIVRNCYCSGNAERGIFTGFTDDILIEYNECLNSVDEHGIYVSNSSQRPIIRYNVCHHNNNIGIHMNGDLSAGENGIITDAQVYGNTLFENQLAAGLNMDGVVGAEVYNNLIYNNHSAQGIAMFQIDGAEVTHDVKVYNNTIIVPNDGRWGILLKDGAQEGTEIFNNIIINHHPWRGAITTESLTGLLSDYNLLSDKMSWEGDGQSYPLSEWQNFSLDVNSHLFLLSDSTFIDVSQNNYHLHPLSMAIDLGNGALVEAVVEDDLDGITRPKGADYDIGCYEYAPIITSTDDIVTSISLSPNPATNFIQINKNFTGEITIHSFEGKPFHFLANQGRINIGSLSPGWYIIDVPYSFGNSKSMKFLKLR